MSEKGANIDLLFRNGLKDYEVLPPAGVWEGIQNTGRVKTRSFLFLRIAAAVTVLLTLSYFTYRFSRELTQDQGTLVAFDISKSDPLIANSIRNNFQAHNLNQNANYVQSAEPESLGEDAIKAAETDVPSVPLFHYGDNRNISLNGSLPARNSLQIAEYETGNKQVNTGYGTLNYAEPELAVKPENRWSLAAFASPTYYSNFTSNQDLFSKKLMESEEPIVSYTGGVGLAYKISKRFSIQSGLYYSTLGQKVDGINSYEGFRPYDNSKGDNNFVIHTTNGEIYASNPDVFLSADASERIATAYTNDVFDPKKANLDYVSNSLTQNLSYLELPFILRYKLVDKTLGINLIGGLSYNLLVGNSVYTTLEGNKYIIGDTKGLNPLSVSSSLGMGMEYSFSKKLSLNLEPTFRYYLNPFSVSVGSISHPYSFGIFSGVSYKF